MGLNLVLFVLLLLATAFFVSAEFAIVKVRSSRIEQYISEGHPKAKALKDVTTNLDGYLSVCQLGITVTALGLGWLGEPTFERLLRPLFEVMEISPPLSHTLSFLIAFSIVTFLHVVLGELAPKSIAIQRAESIGLLIATPLQWLYKLAYPAIWLLNGSANQIVRLFGIQPDQDHEEAPSEEELRYLLSESLEQGEINQTEYRYVSKIFEFDELKAREIMIHRTDMVCLYADQSLEENMRIIQENPYTRFPVIKEDKDHVVGIINAKQIFLSYLNSKEVQLSSLIRPALSVSDITPIKQLLKRMQSEGIHMAILMDEYGGTSGLITIEDILEEIVGSIKDEFDTHEVPELEEIDQHHIIVDGKALLQHVNKYLSVPIESEEFDTIGGWLYGHNPMLQENSKWKYNEWEFTILKRDRHRYRKIEVKSEIEVKS